MSDRICPNCGAPVVAGDRFCVKCGSQLPLEESGSELCPNCHHPVGPDDIFCINCGSPIERNSPEMDNWFVPEQPKSSDSWFKAIAIVAVMILAAAGGGFWMIKSMGSSSQNETEKVAVKEDGKDKKEDQDKDTPDASGDVPIYSSPASNNTNKNQDPTLITPIPDQTPAQTPVQTPTPDPVQTTIPEPDPVPQPPVVKDPEPAPDPEPAQEPAPVESPASTGGISTKSDGWILPGSSSRLYSEAELSGLNSYELCLARNELFARYGYIFKSQELNNYFAAKSWYTPLYTQAEFPHQFTDIERANNDLIEALEAIKGRYVPY